jgi:hypothetical protein
VLFYLVLLWNCAVLCAHKFPITDLSQLFNDKWLTLSNSIRALMMNDFKFVFRQQALMLHIGNRLINHRRHGRAQLFMRTMGNQETKFRTDRSVLRRRKKLRPGGELIFSHRKLCGLSESQRGAVVDKVHCKISKSVSEIAAQIFNGIRFARGSRDN